MEVLMAIDSCWLTIKCHDLTPVVRVARGSAVGDPLHSTTASALSSTPRTVHLFQGFYTGSTFSCFRFINSCRLQVCGHVGCKS